MSGITRLHDAVRGGGLTGKAGAQGQWQRFFQRDAGGLAPMRRAASLLILAQ
jgi:hypothetical protein